MPLSAQEAVWSFAARIAELVAEFCAVNDMPKPSTDNEGKTREGD